ncbi:hypothetical protein GCM10022399_22230 [Terrabacter ginsenosidimutans]|uniref:Putative host cell surface-exposed lipoprotein Ltp-like HTH region domain-containing protein n=1 Tax=Terrabacter ginsenosidimutans TaxID=490575 RepID=A0ABP7DLS1_9MICO
MSDNSYQYPTPDGEPSSSSTWAPPQGAPFTAAGSGMPKPKMGRGKKAGLWAGGIVVAFIAIGAMGGDPKTAPTAAPVVNSSTTDTALAPATAATSSVDTAAADKAAADKAAADKAAADKAAADKAAADKAAADKAAAAKAAAAKAAAAKVAAAKAAAAKAAAAKAAAEEAANAMTVSQEQAVSKAESYLDMMAFSRKGLIKQLQFEQFSKADATFAVDHISANWNEQAAKKAQSYLDMMAFSRGSLINQLTFEGFTSAQARYGVKAVGL